MHSARISLPAPMSGRVSFLLLILFQCLLFFCLFLGAPVLPIALAAFIFILAFLILPVEFGVGLFLLAGAYIPFLDLRWRFYLSALLGIFLLICAADWIRLIRCGRLFPESTELDKYLWAFLASVGIGLMIGILRGATVEEWPLELFPYLALAVAPIASRYLSFSSIHRIFTLFVICTLIQSVCAAVFFAQGGFLRFADPLFAIHPSLGAVVLFAVSVFHPSRLWRTISGIAMVPLLVQLLCSMTRGYWFGCLAGMMVVLVFAFRYLPARQFWRMLRIRAGSVLLLVGGTLLILNAQGVLSSLVMLGERFGSFSDIGADASTQVRFAEWTAAWKAFLKQPVFGNGLGYRLQFFHPYKYKRFHQWWMVHNSYLLIILKLGLLGLITFIYFVSGALRLGRRAISRSDTPLAFCYSVGFTANIIQFLTVAFTNYTFSKSVNMTYIGFILGALVVLGRSGENTGRSFLKRISTA